MGTRTAESPMDFEWQTRAPGDVTSPFYQLSMQHESDKNRPQSIFDSPTKFKTPSQPSLFQQLSPSKISSPSRNDAPMFGKPAFTTPRKMDIDFSSGAENMSSPETADNEETPEPPRKREKRNSLWNLYGRFAPSPGRGEIPRPGHPPDTHARRIQKRRRRDREIDRHLRMELDSDYDSDRPSSSEWRFSRKPRLKKREQSQEQAPPQQQPPPSPWSLSSILGAIEAHPNVPRILSYWTQYFVNTLIFMLFTYVVWSFFATLRADISAGTKMKYDQIERKRNECATNYVANKCGADERLPALQQACKEWAECMSMDTSVARTLVGAETIGEVYTAFTNSISYKGFAFFLLTICTITFANNYAFRSFRDQLEHQFQHVHAQPQHSHRPDQSQPQHQQQSSQPQQPQPFQQTIYNPLPDIPPRTPSRRDHEHDEDHDDEDDEKPQKLLLENDSAAHIHPFVTGRSKEREEHLRRTPSSPLKRGRRYY